MQQGAAVDRDLQDLAGRFLDFMHRATKLPMIVRAGTFGLTGSLDVSQPVTRIASAVLGSWIKERRQQAKLHAAEVRGVVEALQHAVAGLANDQGVRP